MRIRKFLLCLVGITLSTLCYCQDYLYGLTQYGGYYNKGVPYQIRTDGKDFISYTDLDGNNGEKPGNGAAFTQLIPNLTIGNIMVALTERGDQNLGHGNRLQITPGRGGLVPPFRFRFSREVTGINPSGRFLTAFDGTLYGMTSVYGQFGGGCLFSMPPVFGNGATTLVAFDGPEKGKSPKGSLIQGSDGKFYGMTELGGTHDLGVIFSYARYGNVPFKKLLDFDGTLKGSNPTGNLVIASNGTMYGMTRTGGLHGDGVIFSISPDGTAFTKLLDLEGAITGANPYGGLTEFTDGKLYGMTSSGGAYGYGTIFHITTDGVFSKVFDFDGLNGKEPRGDLLLSPDGLTMYGVTYAGGLTDKGVLFKLENGSIFTKIYEFEEVTGSHPVGTLAMQRKSAVINFPAIPEMNTLSEPFSPVAVSSAGLPIYYTTGDASVAVVENNQIRITGAGATTITAFQLGNHEYLPQSETQMIIVKKVSQTITFPEIEPKTYGDPSFTLHATSSSGLPVTFSIFSNDVISSDGVNMYIKGAGTLEIRAVQNGNDTYEAAEVVKRTLVVDRAEQTIDFTPEPSRVCCTEFFLSASASSGLNVLFKTPDRDKLRIDGSYVEMLKLGTAEIVAYHPGDRNYKPAEARATVDISKGSQVIYLNLPKTTYVFGEQPPYVVAGSSRALPVTFVSDPPGIAVVEGSTLHLLGIGTTTITATQSGTDLIYPAQTISEKVTVVPPVIPAVGNTIKWASLPDKTLLDPPFNLTGSASSGLPVSYTSSNTAVAEISGNLVTIKGVGSTTITASQSGNASTPPATRVERVLNVTKASHYIDFSIVSSVVFGTEAIQLPITTSSRLPITYSSSNKDVAYVEDYFLHFKSAGSATITASHPGDEKYMAVQPVSKRISVFAKNQAINFDPLPVKTFADEPFDLIATASSGYEVVFSSSDPEIASVDGKTVTIHNAGTVMIKATQSGYPGFSAAENSRSLVINKLSQVITFNELQAKKFSDRPFGISATTDSGLPISLHSATPGVAKVSGNVVTITGNGMAEIVASQAGDRNYLPAVSVSRKFLVEDAGNTYDLVGTVYGGGPNGSGGIYSMKSDGSEFNVLRGFALRTAPSPQGGFIKGSDGKLYGNFHRGGLHNNGRIVRMEADGTNLTVLYDYYYPTGSSPFGNLIQAANGDLYGVTRSGGTNEGGVIFRIKTDGTGYEVLYNFTSSLSGSSPLGGLVQASNGRLYGMTPNGGFFQSGTIFSINDDGSDFTVIFHFDDRGPKNTGFSPRGDLVSGPDGFLYGTLMQGGSNGGGTLFKIRNDGTGFTKIIDFNPSLSGASPSSTICIATDGIIYGTTQAGGANNMGTLFSVTTDGGNFSRIHDFDGAATGSNPVGELMEAVDGFLYGLTNSGGVNSKGTVFKIGKDGSGFEKLADLDDRASSPVFGPIIESTLGNFFAMVSQGGPNNAGAIIEVSSEGTLSIIKDFPQEESGPRSLISDPSGEYYYGITGYGGESNGGTIFRMDASGDVYEQLMSMPNGSTVSELFYISTGHLWCLGTENGINFIFRVKPDGSEFERLVSFDNYSEEGSGASWLVEASDGHVYGISARSANGGLVFRMKNDGSGFTTLLNFPAGREVGSGGFIQASDGNFYGCTTYSGHLYRFDVSGALTMFKYPDEGGNVPMKIIELNGGSLAVATRDDPGSIFTIEKDGTSFSKIYDQTFANGLSPVDMLQTMDGWIYVAAEIGGIYQKGVVYKMRPDGSEFTKLREFNDHDGNSPTAIFFKKASQTLTFPPLPEKKVSDPAFVADAFSNSGATVRLSSNDPDIAIIEDGKIKPVAVGTATITAHLPGNANFFQGRDVQQQLRVVKGEQTISFHDLPTIYVSEGPLTLYAVSSSGLPVSFKSSDPEIASVSGNTVVIHRAGTITIAAAQDGNENYSQAETIYRDLVILNRGSQTITFKSPGAKVLGDSPFHLEASTSSGLNVNFSTTANEVSIEGSLVTILQSGYVTITAHQDGDVHFDPAPAVSISFCVNAPRPTITVSGAGADLVLESSNNEGNQWYSNSQLVAGATSKMFRPKETGSYHVNTIVEGCESLMSVPYSFVITGLTEDPALFFDIYPNPIIAGDLNVGIQGQLDTTVSLELLDAIGRCIAMRQVSEPGIASFDLRARAPGIYLVRIKLNGEIFLKRIVKR